MKLEISDVAPHINGSYDLDLASFTNRELHQIKIASGVRPLELTEALVYSDAAFICAVAEIAITRTGRRINHDILMDAAGGSIKVSFGEPVEDDPENPTPRAKPATRRKSSGSRSKSSSASPADAPSPSGAQT